MSAKEQTRNIRLTHFRGERNFRFRCVTLLSLAFHRKCRVHQKVCTHIGERTPNYYIDCGMGNRSASLRPPPKPFSFQRTRFRFRTCTQKVHSADIFDFIIDQCTNCVPLHLFPSLKY